MNQNKKVFYGIVIVVVLVLVWAVAVNITGPKKVSNSGQWGDTVSNLYLGGYAAGQSNFQRTSTFATGKDRMCVKGVLAQAVPAGKFGIAIYNVTTNQYQRPKMYFTSEVAAGDFMACENVQFPKGQYELQAYWNDVMQAKFPFIVQ